MSLLLGLAMALAAPTAAADPGEPRLILFGANWCAPCRAELSNLPVLADAARPVPLVVAWLDRQAPAAAERAVQGARLASPAEARALAKAHGRGLTGLPYSVMVGSDGVVCADHKAQLSVEAIARMRGACRR